AGLTNMVFLPDHAVVVQVVPLGGLEGIAKTDFGEPSKEMNLRYLKYSIRVKESSLSTQYANDDVVLRDPIAIHKQGWDALRATYLVKQNVKLDVRRFRSTLIKALKLLHR
nr:EGF domain-specific O-linked N-acetylglucosamine transferase-like [Tanacetum cinerariifolium]